MLVSPDYEVDWLVSIRSVKECKKIDLLVQESRKDSIDPENSLTEVQGI